MQGNTGSCTIQKHLSCTEREALRLLGDLAEKSPIRLQCLSEGQFSSPLPSKEKQERALPSCKKVVFHLKGIVCQDGRKESQMCPKVECSSHHNHLGTDFGRSKQPKLPKQRTGHCAMPWDRPFQKSKILPNVGSRGFAAASCVATGGQLPFSASQLMAELVCAFQRAMWASALGTAASETRQKVSKNRCFHAFAMSSATGSQVKWLRGPDPPYGHAFVLSPAVSSWYQG